MKHILKCEKCGKYTLKDSCHGKTIRPIPVKYSLDYKYAEYRRRLKKKDLIKQGVL